MKCIVCGEPVPPALRDIGMCGPCTTGEADTCFGGDDDAHEWVPEPPRPERVKCPHCGKMTGGLAQHVAAKHSPASSTEGTSNG